MTLKWIEGFETHRILSQLTRKYNSTSGSGAITSQTGRVAGFAISGQPVLVTASFGSPQNVGILGFGLYITANFTAGTNGFYLERGGVEQCSIRFSNTAGTFNLTLTRGGTVIATSTSNFAYGQWHFFELKVTARTGTNGVYELRHNEVTEFSGSSVNLAGSGSDGIDNIALRMAANIDVRWDDIYFCDDQGSINNNFKGDSQIRGGLPNGAGDVQQFTLGTGATHHLLVDEAATSAPSDGTDVNFDDTNGHKELYDFQDLSTVNGNIYGLMLCSQLAMNAAGSRVLKHVYRDISNTEYNPANFTVNSTTYTEFQNILEQNPISAVDWTESDINNAQFGVEVVS